MASSYSLGDHFEKFVKRMVASGRYASASEVMRDGLRLMEERERVQDAKMEALRHALQEGLDSGPAAPLDMSAISTRAKQQRKRKMAGQSASE